MACNDCLTLNELYNILDNYSFSGSGGGIPVGGRITIGQATLSAYFDASGLGGGIWDGWAVSNGLNGTSNRLGKFPVYYNTSGSFTTVGATGGSETVTLTSTELPAHTHSFALPSHTHPVTDSGHTHTASSSTALSSVSIDSALGISANVSNSFTTTLNKQQIRIEDDPTAITNAIDIEVFVSSVNLQGYGGLTSGTEAVALGGSGSVTFPAHSHNLSPASLSHNHPTTISTNTSGITVGAPTAEVSGATGSTGAGQPFSILPPYIVEIPVEKIS